MRRRGYRRKGYGKRRVRSLRRRRVRGGIRRTTRRKALGHVGGINL